MKKNLFFLLILLASCASPTPTESIQPIVVTPWPSVSPIPPAATQAPSATPYLAGCAPSEIKTVNEYNALFIQSIGVETIKEENKCRPDQIKNDAGIYIYDLTGNRELVSVNADTPYQFASAFKSIALVYFLSNCREYWDVSSPEWDTRFRNPELARDVWYTSDEYKTRISDYLVDPNHWKAVDVFFAANKAETNGFEAPIDSRYFVLSKVYSMIAASSNQAAGEVLLFVFNNCALQKEPEALIAQVKCSGPNAITAFNEWFYQFTGIDYSQGAPHSGLFNWDIINEKNKLGKYVETAMPTSGLKDTCASNFAILDCVESRRASNAMTAREFYMFYHALYRMEYAALRNTALTLLGIDTPGASRGFLKDMARNIGAFSMSKNGNAFFIYGPIISDAGIVQYKGNDFIVVALTFNSEQAVTNLYGGFNEDGFLITPPGLIAQTLEDSLKCAQPTP